MIIELTGKTALICGASSGIGLAISTAFAECGAKVIIAARREEMLKELKARLDGINNLDNGIAAADFSNPDEAMSKIKAMIGGTDVDILVNNSGGPAPGPLSKADEGELLKAFNSHVVMSQKLTKHAIINMKKKNWGRIINIISVSAKQPIENLGVSNTIRGAMNAWSKTLSKELAPFGITINSILPGYTATQRLADIFSATAGKLGITREQAELEMIKKIPAGRLGLPEEPANLAAFLASDLANYITGTAIQVDG